MYICMNECQCEKLSTLGKTLNMKTSLGEILQDDEQQGQKLFVFLKQAKLYYRA